MDVSDRYTTPPWHLSGQPFQVGDEWRGHYCIAAGWPGTWMYPDSMALLEGEDAEIIHEPFIEVKLT